MIFATKKHENTVCYQQSRFVSFVANLFATLAHLYSERWAELVTLRVLSFSFMALFFKIIS